ncbi:HmuY family protein [Aquimarina pacifica]|uniref:HmuY family protein n=1 Tax=Aquimarina pacifica TaxID=1296415 RepID=UPI0004729392|nr:HmuY family protein [Aquimarina pacifica]
MKKVFLLFIGIISMLASCDSNDDATQSEEFTVVGLSVDQGSSGTEITISGTGFPDSSEDVTVTFNGVEAEVSSISSTSILVIVPDTVDSGEVSVTFNAETLSAGTFTIIEALVEGTIENLYAPLTSNFGEPDAGEFTKFDFETGAETDSNTDWDIAFRGTTIAVNGGAATGTDDEPERNGDASVAIVTGTFDSVASVDGLTFLQDSIEDGFAIPTGSNNGWYNYDFTTNIISAIPGVVLVFKTKNGNYAKVEILSYYEDQDNSGNGRYYTFNYVYNPNDGGTSF